MYNFFQEHPLKLLYFDTNINFLYNFFQEQPLKLTWSEAADCYYSQDMEIPTGVYKGTLVVDQKPYPVEEVTVKHYTFEADLYIKEGN